MIEWDQLTIVGSWHSQLSLREVMLSCSGTVRVAPARRAESVPNFWHVLNLAPPSFSPSAFLLQIIVEITLVFQWRGVGWGSSFNLHFYFLALYYMGNLWKKRGKLKNERKRWLEMPEHVNRKTTRTELLNPLGVSTCYGGFFLSAHASNCRGAGDA